jgi:hypothetical protein
MRLFAALPCLALLLSAPALAQDETAPKPAEPPAGSERPTIMVEPVGMLIASFDADGDGQVTRAELDAGVLRSFKAIDTAGSGRMGYIEFADWAERYLGDRNALPSPFQVDRNGDSVITPDELRVAIEHIFDRFDENKKGVVTRAELLTIHDTPGGSFGGGRSGGGRRGGGGRGGHRGGGMGGGGMSGGQRGGGDS